MNGISQRIPKSAAPPESWAEPGQKVGDFTTNRRVIPMSLLALVVGAVSAFVALALLRLIGLFTNLFFFQRWSTAATTGLTALLVVDRTARGRLLGLVTLDDMLKARVRHLEEERRRERVLPLRLLVPFGRFAGGRRREAATPAPVESPPSSEIETGV